MATIMAIRHSHFDPTHSARRTWQVSCKLLGALLGIGGGLLAMFLVPLFWFLSWLLHDAQLNSLSTFIAYLVLPLLIVGGWCVDALEKRQTPSAASDDDADD